MAPAHRPDCRTGLEHAVAIATRTEVPQPARLPTQEQALRGRQRRDNLTALAFIAPAMIGFVLFVIVPALAGLSLTFFQWDLITSPEWVGLKNINRLIADPAVWESLKVTVFFVVLGVVPTVLLGFVLGVLINQKMRGIGALRILYFAPMVASSTVAAVLWAYMYDPRSGLANQLLAKVGLTGPSWLSDTSWALPALTLMIIWLALPLVMILYLAGLQRIPDDVYAAADLDGCGRWRMLWSITWPNVLPTTVLVGILQIIDFVSSSFEVSLIMTQGGPLGSTQSLALYSYFAAFQNGEMGYASAISLFQLLLIGLIVGAVRLVTKIVARRTA